MACMRQALLEELHPYATFEVLELNVLQGAHCSQNITSFPTPTGFIVHSPSEGKRCLTTCMQMQPTQPATKRKSQHKTEAIVSATFTPPSFVTYVQGNPSPVCCWA